MSCNPSAQNLSEAPDKSPRSSGTEGYVLPLILVLALVGTLLGLCRLTLFRQQCTLRFDRQREIERILATRSALRWLAVQPLPPATAQKFIYGINSSRQIRVEVRPVDPIYPKPGYANHLNISSGNFNVLDVEISSAEFGMNPQPFYDEQINSWTMQIGSTGETGKVGYARILMTNSWQDDPWGRRYWVKPESFNLGVNPEEESTPGDVFRLRLEPFNSGSGNPAIWIEHAPMGNQSETVVKYRNSEGQEHVCTGAGLPLGKAKLTDAKGVQLAGNSLVMFYMYPHLELGNPNAYQYNFGDPYLLPDDVAESFRGQALYLTLEVESFSPQQDENTFRWIRVDPAYEYEVALEWQTPNFDKSTATEEERNAGVRITNEVATVAHVFVEADEYSEFGFNSVTFTYDSHGTGHRGR